MSKATPADTFTVYVMASTASTLACGISLGWAILEVRADDLAGSVLGFSITPLLFVAATVLGVKAEHLLNTIREQR